jgi:hypothetical protein
MAGNAGVAKAVVADTNPIRTTHGGLNDSSTTSPIPFFETFVVAVEEVDGSCVVVGWGGPACVERYCPFVRLPAVCDHRSCGIL